MQVSNRPLPNGTMWWCERGWKIVRNNYFPTLLDTTESIFATHILIVAIIMAKIFTWRNKWRNNGTVNII